MELERDFGMEMEPDRKCSLSEVSAEGWGKWKGRINGGRNKARENSTERDNKLPTRRKESYGGAWRRKTERIIHQTIDRR